MSPVDDRSAAPPASLGTVVLLTPLLVRLILLVIDPDPYFHLGDSFEYLEAEGPATERPFGYSLFLHVCLAVLGRSLQGVVVAQSLLGFAAALIYYRVATRYLGLRGGIVAGLYLALSLWPLNLLYEHTIMAESLFCFVLALVVLYAFKTVHQGRGAFTLGMLVAGLALVRGLGLLLIPILVGAVLLGRRGQTLSARARRALLVVLGSCSLLVPYASVNLQSSGFLGTVAFRGRTMFPYVVELVRPERVEDPSIREVLAEREHQIRWMPNNELRWSWTVMPEIHRRVEGRSLREMGAEPWPSSPEVQGALRRYWPNQRSERASLARLDKALTKTATQAILGDLPGYLRIVGRQLVALTLDVGTTSATHRLFQSRETIDRSRHPWDRSWFESHKERLRLASGHEVPDASSGALHALCARLFDSRLTFLVFALISLAALLGQRRLSRSHLLLVAMLVVVTFVPILLQEYYGRYFVPAINLFLVLIAAGLAALPRKSTLALALLALGCQLTLSWTRLPDAFPRAWDYARADTWGAATFHRTNRDGEISVPAGTTGAAGLVQVMGTTTADGGVWALIYTDADGDGTPPDSASERFTGHDLSHGVTSLVMQVRGRCDPSRVGVFLRDREGLDTMGGAGAPVLADYLDGPLNPETWTRVAIPLDRFPRFEDERRPVAIPLPRDHSPNAALSDGTEVGVVDFSWIVALGLVFRGRPGEAREPFLMQLDKVRFTGDRTVLWCEEDDTRP